MRRFAVLTLCAATVVGGCHSTPPAPPPPPGYDTVQIVGPSPGRFVTYESFPSKFVAARKVVVWVPEGYDGSDRRYAVLYMHDGQNLYDPATSMAGQPWGVDRHLAALEASGRIRPTIVVGVWNTPTRAQDYAPAAPLATVSPAAREVGTPDGKPVFSDGYVKFLAEELKPFIDAHFRTRPGREDTFVMGSSMGGLISLYALALRPDVFGGAGCLSTHWVITTHGRTVDRHHEHPDARIDELARAYEDWLRTHLPRAGTHRLYFDHGSEHLDALYGPYQARIDAMLAELGYRQDVDVMTRVYPGATHNEEAWRARLAVPLTFLLQP